MLMGSRKFFKLFLWIRLNSTDMNNVFFTALFMPGEGVNLRFKTKENSFAGRYSNERIHVLTPAAARSAHIDI